MKTKKQATTAPMPDLARQDDRELIASCLNGEHAAWETLVSRYQRLIYSIPLKSRLSADDAADIFQSVCLKLFEKLATLREHDKISSWLITTTTRECWRVSARSRREARTLNADDESASDSLSQIPAVEPLADEQHEMLERQQAVRNAIETLSERCRELLMMLFYEREESSYAEIARRMAMPVPSVGPTRARCLEKLKRVLQGKI
jgi:RNA polymerase sigma factor (sigma-70 family)